MSEPTQNSQAALPPEVQGEAEDDKDELSTSNSTTFREDIVGLVLAKHDRTKYVVAKNSNSTQKIQYSS